MVADNNVVTLKELLPNSYSFTKPITGPTNENNDNGATQQPHHSFEDIVDYVIETLKAHKFGVVTRLDAHKILKTKLDVDLSSPLVILGVCQPLLALDLLQVDPSAACFLPCKVVVTQNAASFLQPQPQVVVSFAKPSRVFAGTEHEGFQKRAQQIDGLLEACFNDLQ